MTGRPGRGPRAVPGALILAVAAGAFFSALTPTDASAQEARRRWERQCQIRAEKFDVVLPKAMRDNDIDMWVTVMREGLHYPLYEALGRGYVGGCAYYVFTNRGDGNLMSIQGKGDEKGHRMER